MFETLESRRMMSVSTTTTQEPVVQSTTTSLEADDLQAASRMLSMLQNAVNDAIKSLAEAAQNAAHRA